MITEKTRITGFVAAYLLAMASLSGSAIAQSTSSSRGSDTQAAANTGGGKTELTAMKHVNDAVAVVHTMESEPGMNKLLQQAKGVFIVPSYGRAALGIGGSGGAGVLLAKRDDGTWSDPAFYNLGAISIGMQAGAEGGPIAMVLNNDKAVNHFMQKNNFSLSADAGLTVVNWAKAAQGEVGMGDVVAWAGNKGFFGNVASIGVNDIRFNQNQNDAYYHQTVAVKDVISGKVKNSQADTLKQALAATSTGTASGSSGVSPARGGSGGSSDSTGTPDSKK
ncbi:MAG TPA: lipid-binding SYLF domain-containing protein [Noviherbaspirillum sp.]|nr:lipid-binding SYLF domain-containing protein [Noviherbaspirillum sp.]